MVPRQPSDQNSGLMALDEFATNLSLYDDASHWMAEKLWEQKSTTCLETGSNVKGPLPPSVLFKASKKSDDLNGQVKVKRKCGRPRNPIPRHKRESHINAEHRRRGKIQDGFRTLKNMVPKCEQTSGRDSKADILFKTVDFCKVAEHDIKENQAVIDSLTMEMEALSTDIKNFKALCPDVSLEELSTTMEDRYSDFVQQRIKNSWSFWAFSYVMRPLFESYVLSVSGQSMSTFFQSVTDWAANHLSPDNLRAVCSMALKHVSMDKGQNASGASHTEGIGPRSVHRGMLTLGSSSFDDKQNQLAPMSSIRDSLLQSPSSNGPINQITPLSSHTGQTRSGSGTEVQQLPTPPASHHGLFSPDHQSAFHRPDGSDGASSVDGQTDFRQGLSYPSRSELSVKPSEMYLPLDQRHYAPLAYGGASVQSYDTWQQDPLFSNPPLSHNVHHQEQYPHYQQHQQQQQDPFYSGSNATFMYPPYSSHLQELNKGSNPYLSDLSQGGKDSNNPFGVYNHLNSLDKYVKQEFPRASEPLLPPSGQSKPDLADISMSTTRNRNASRSSSEGDAYGLGMSAFAKQTSDTLLEGNKYSQLSPSTDGGLSPSSGSYLGSPGAQNSSPNSLEWPSVYRGLHVPHPPQGVSGAGSLDTSRAVQNVSLPSYTDAFGKTEIFKGSGMLMATHDGSRRKSSIDFDFKIPGPVKSREQFLGSSLALGSKMHGFESSSLLAELLNPQQRTSTLSTPHGSLIETTHGFYNHGSSLFPNSSGLQNFLHASSDSLTNSAHNDQLRLTQNNPRNADNSDNNGTGPNLVGNDQSHFLTNQDSHLERTFDHNSKSCKDIPTSPGASDTNNEPNKTAASHFSYFEMAHQNPLKAYGPTSSTSQLSATSPSSTSSCGSDVNRLPIFPACGLSRHSPLSYNPASYSTCPMERQLGTGVPNSDIPSTSPLLPLTPLSPTGTEEMTKKTRKTSFEDSFPEGVSGAELDVSKEKRPCRGHSDETCPFTLSTESIDSFQGRDSSSLVHPSQEDSRAAMPS